MLIKSTSKYLYKTVLFAILTRVIKRLWNFKYRVCHVFQQWHQVGSDAILCGYSSKNHHISVTALHITFKLNWPFKIALHKIHVRFKVILDIRFTKNVRRFFNFFNIFFYTGSILAVLVDCHKTHNAQKNLKNL